MLLPVCCAESSAWHAEKPRLTIRVLASCMEALRGLVIGQETDLRAMDNGEIYFFEFQDGSTWTVSFDGGNLEKNGKCYETEGYGSLKQQIRQYAENCDITE